jgi:CheY-like chemotaxis protein
MLQVSVSDTGIGIPESEIPHIFDEFRQADSSTSRAYDGSGLGLAIARRYAEMLGGSISVASRESEGSTFTLSLPLRARKQPAIKADRKGEVPGRPKPSTTALAPSERAGRTLLLVEDSEPAVIQISDILEEAGYQLLIARDGRQALEVLASTRPDAVILDLMMPEMDGFAVLRSMREVEATARIPVLILTGRYVSLDEQTFLRHNHIHQLVQKGALNRAELLAVVDGMLALPPENAVKAPPTRRAPADKLNVLVVEDNPDNMLSVRALLAGEEFNVIEAVDGEQGFALARSHRPDLVLMDIALPKMDGIQALQAIRRDPGLQHVRVVALTASAMTTDREKVLAYGFDGYIPKPIDHEVFMRTIRQVIYGTH